MSPLQKKILKTYEEFKRICDKHGLFYVAIGGTELGAIRHHGFIPWDDDMDIGMPISDYEKFEKIVNGEIRSPYKFAPSPWMGGKIHDTSTSFIETSVCTMPEKYYGVFVDIFPLIGIPDNKEERSSFLKEVRAFNVTGLIWERYESILNRPVKELSKWRNTILHKYDFRKTKNSIEFSGGYFFVHDTDLLMKRKELKFENTTIYVGGDYDLALSRQYGDYMKLPKKRERFSHSFSLVDLGRPYDYYCKKFENIDPKLLALLEKKHHLEGEWFNSSMFLKIENEDLKNDIDNLKKELENQRKELENQRNYLADLKKSRSYRLGRAIIHPIKVIRGK